MARRLTRNRRAAVIGGVAAGFGEYVDVDPVLVRLGFVLLTFATGIGVLFYPICWVIMPADEPPVPGQSSPGEQVAEEVRAAAERVASDVRKAGASGRAHMLGGVILVALGLMFLVDRVPWRIHWLSWLRFDNAWPLIIVAIGVVLVLRAREEQA